MLVVVRGLRVRRAAEVGMRVVVRRLGGPVGMRGVAGRVRLVVRVLVPVRMDMRVAVRMAVHQVAMPVRVVVDVLVLVIVLVAVGHHGGVPDGHCCSFGYRRR
jgi:hypothetical protein